MTKCTQEQRDNLVRWIEALESGKYNQCFGFLRAGDCFCALGVMYDISNVGRWTRRGENVLVWDYDTDNISLCEWIGPQVGDFCRKVLQWNDAECCTFDQIAQRLRNNYLT